jgi:3-oxoadipate enol-lactonase
LALEAGRESVSQVTYLHYECAGRGSAVVLLHSGVTDLRQWDPQWEDLSTRYRVVRCDRRGWGSSPLPEASASASYSDAGDIVGLLDELGIERAALAEGAVDEAVELNVTTFLGPDASMETRDLVREMQRNAFEVQLAAGDDVPREPGPTIDLTQATKLAYVVSGGRDLDYFAHAADSLAQQLPDARRIVLPWAGHLPNLERPREVTTLLVDALG